MIFDDFDDLQAEADLAAVLKHRTQDHRRDMAQSDQNWLDLYANDPETVVSASAALILSALERRKPDPMLADIWDIVRPHLPAAPNPTRAAFACGLVILSKYQLLPETPAFEKSDYLSVSKAEVEKGLVTLAYSLVDDVDAIAHADYGYRADEHRRALLDMRATDFEQVPLKERWVPMEVLELVSHSPGQAGHIPALAIVLLDAVRSLDFHGAVGFRWETQHADICALPPPIRKTLLTGFRYFYEADPNCSYSLRVWKKKAGLLPWGGTL